MAAIYNPMVPFIEPIQGGLIPGRMIRIHGNVPSGAQRFAVNLQCGPMTDPRDDIALHMNFRFVEQCIVRNSLIALDWGNEELRGGMPLQKGQAFEILILCEPNCLKVALNGVHFCEFMHRLPFQRISHLTVDGDVSIQYVGFESTGQEPAFMPPAPPPYGGGQYQQPPYGQAYAPQGFY